MNLTENSSTYTSNVFMVFGYWNYVEDLTTLVDVGSDCSIIQKIEELNTGLGKRKVDQVIITHSHSDHTGMLQLIKKKFNPIVYAFNPFLEGVDRVICDGDILKIGDKSFEVFNITVHSNDSICLFCEEEGILFAGDTFFPIEFDNPSIEAANSGALQRLTTKKIQTVYFGHGAVKTYNRNFQCIRSKTIQCKK